MDWLLIMALEKPETVWIEHFILLMVFFLIHQFIELLLFLYLSIMWMFVL